MRRRAALYLLGSAFSASLSFIALPFTTRILGPADYGAFALVQSVAGIGISLGSLGMGFAIANGWLDRSAEQRSQLVSTLFAFAAVAVTGWAVVMIGGAMLLRIASDTGPSIPIASVALTAIGMVATPFWLIAVDVLTVSGRARLFTGITVAEAIIRVGVTLVALYAWQLGQVSLFLGYAVGATFQGIASVAAFRANLQVPRRDSLLAHATLARAFVMAQVSDTGYVLLERTALSAGTGLTSLGLFSHSQRYREVSMLAVKAASRGVWPVSLLEAGEEPRRFTRTRRTWEAIYLMLAVAGVAAAMVGATVIGLLTNGKFTTAYVFAALWQVVILVNMAARPHQAVLFVQGRGRDAAGLETRSNIAALAVLPSVLAIGPLGALLAAAAKALTYRVALIRIVRRHGSIPSSQDGFAVSGAAVVLLALALDGVLGPALATRIGVVAVAAAVAPAVWHLRWR